MAETPNEEEVARVRARGREILATIGSDPAFAEQVRKDPTAALVSRGIPEAAALDWQKKPGGGEVSGYDYGDEPSCGYSCTSTSSAGCGWTDGTVYY